MGAVSLILRRLKGSRPCGRAPFSFSSEILMMSSIATASYCSLAHSEPLSNSTMAPTPSTTATATAAVAITAKFHSPQFDSRRNFCTSSSSGPSTVVLIKSEEQFNNSLRKVQDESLPAIFYFTAVWCGPCRLLGPIIGQLTEKYPNVTTYKIDIDQEGLESALSKLNIHSVPTLHFFQNGKKASEIIGADVQRLHDTMEELYE